MKKQEGRSKREEARGGKRSTLVLTVVELAVLGRAIVLDLLALRDWGDRAIASVEKVTVGFNCNLKKVPIVRLLN
ncbi:MAG: hypothetical protein ACRC62_10885 [Microcoleus sp.]